MIGIPLEWFVLRVVILEESGFDFPVLFPWGPALVIASGSLGIATLAGLIPARMAMRTRIPDAVATE
jgi:putative ABC transport system permease protein